MVCDTTFDLVLANPVAETLSQRSSPTMEIRQTSRGQIQFSTRQTDMGH